MYILKRNITSKQLVLPAILLLALLLRLIWVFNFCALPVNDALHYEQLANILLNEHHFAINGMPKANTLPGYPFFIALIYFLTGKSLLIFYGIQAVLGTSTVYWLWLISKQQQIPHRVGIMAALLLATYINVIAYTSLMLTETLFVFCMMGGIFFWLRMIASKFSVTLILAGSLLMGYSILIKPQILIFYILFWAFNLYKYKNYRTQIIVIACCFILPFLWMLRNRSQVGEFALSTNHWENIFIGNHSGATGSYENPLLIQGIDTTRELEPQYEEQAKQFLSHPNKEHFNLLFKKIKAQYRYETDGINWSQRSIPKYYWEEWKRWSQLQYLILLGLCIFALGLFILKKVKIPSLIFQSILSFFIIGILFFGDSRFHFPTIPFICLMAACAINFFLIKLRPIWKILKK